MKHNEIFHFRFITQTGHWKTENPFIIFASKIIENYKNKNCVCKSYFCLISFSLSEAALYYLIIYITWIFIISFILMIDSVLIILLQNIYRNRKDGHQSTC